MTLQFARKVGVGRLKLEDLRLAWVHEVLDSGAYTLTKVPGCIDASDMMTSAIQQQVEAVPATASPCIRWSAARVR